jgi:hypothetical protein
MAYCMDCSDSSAPAPGSCTDMAVPVSNFVTLPVDVPDMRTMTVQWNPKTGDSRPYARTAEPVGDNPEAPQRDWSDDRFAWFLSKRIYLGRECKVKKLFWLLAEHLGRPHLIHEVQEAVDGFASDASMGVSDDEVRKADQRLRQTVSRLRERLRSSGVEDHVFIHREHTARGPALTMYRRYLN